jgi:hypothetical protein
MKWINRYGPRKVKPIAQLIKDLGEEVGTFTELSGTIGGEERRSKIWSPYGGPRNQVAIDKMKLIGTKYNWEITDANAAALEADLKAALADAKAARPVIDQRISQEERQATIQANVARQQEQAAKDAACAEAFKAIMAKKPPGATAIIIAEYRKDESDSMTDYFGSRVERTVAIGWRYGSRESFMQMRRAARLFPETRHLGDGDATVEQRENWSGGDGYYLSSTGRNGTGWKVRSISFGYARYGKPIEDGLQAFTLDVPVGLESADDVEIRENTEMGGIEIHFKSKPSRDVLGLLKSQGWRWANRSKCWYKRNGNGVREEAERIVSALVPVPA